MKHETKLIDVSEQVAWRLFMSDETVASQKLQSTSTKMT